MIVTLKTSNKRNAKSLIEIRGRKKGKVEFFLQAEFGETLNVTSLDSLKVIFYDLIQTY